MSLKVIGAGTFTTDNLADFTAPPAWRKATRNMIMATACVQKALDDQIPGWLSEAGERVGLIVGTNSGELETTTEFLATLVKSGMARPVLFQNSLHNATAGFVTIHFKIRGPSITLSSGLNTPQECVQLAEGLIADGVVDVCILVLVEGHQRVVELLNPPPTGERVRDGACAMVVASKGMAERWGDKGAHSLDLNQAKEPYLPLKHPPFFQIEDSGFFRLARMWEGSR